MSRRQLTVGELRKLIADVPADTPVVVHAPDNDPKATYVAAKCYETRVRALNIAGDADERETNVLHLCVDIEAWTPRYR